MPGNYRNFLFVDMSAADSAKPFDGVASGTFTDMLGRTFTLLAKDFPTFVTNTLAALESTRDSSGQIVGFPIDQRHHEHGDAAGWIVSVALAEDGQKIRFTPRWTQAGLSLIATNEQRFFSPEIDLQNKVIAGGSLTNWPATRSKDGKILLAPIELEQGSGIYQLGQDPSINKQLHAIVKAFYERFANDASLEGDGWWDLEILDVWNDRLIVVDGEKVYEVKYTEKDGIFEFIPRPNWTEGELTFVAKAIRAARQAIKNVFAGLFPQQPVTQPQPTEDDDMVDLAKLTPEQKAELLSQARAELASGNVSAELNTQIDQLANERVAVLLAQQERKSKAAQFVAQYVGGTTDKPAGIPVDRAELETLLASLTPDQEAKVQEILTKVRDAKLVDFAEHGHSKTVPAQRQLPAEIKRELVTYLAASDKNSLAEFFAINAVELGAQSDYDLTEFEKKEK
jgi:hypothetical protein